MYFFFNPLEVTQLWDDEKYPALKILAESDKKASLESFLKNESRNEALFFQPEGLSLTVDLTRQRLSLNSLKELIAFANSQNIMDKIRNMISGECINKTENRPVLHLALRRPKSTPLKVNDVDITQQISACMSKVANFSDNIRKGEHKGYLNDPITNVVCIGTGGSILGTKFVYTAFNTMPQCIKDSFGRRLSFISNIDPTDFKLTISKCKQRSTIIIIVSKSFTTKETMDNATEAKNWFLNVFDEIHLKNHMVAITSNSEAAINFGIPDSNIFNMWDWVGGRYSVTSAIGCLPLAIHFGIFHVIEFISGCYSMDEHFITTPIESNIPILMALMNIWNTCFLKNAGLAIVPYAKGLKCFPDHIQQLAMESNGKRVTLNGVELKGNPCPIYFGGCGTDVQHSFFQYLHQCTNVPVEFIGFFKPHYDIKKKGKVHFSSHQKLLFNMIGQAEALAIGRSHQSMVEEKIPAKLIPHKECPGNRASSILLFELLTPETLGCLLSLYENRIVAEGFLLNINSFDQEGVELGKHLSLTIENSWSKDQSIGTAKPFMNNTIKLVDLVIEKFNQKLN